MSDVDPSLSEIVRRLQVMPEVRVEARERLARELETVTRPRQTKWLQLYAVAATILLLATATWGVFQATGRNRTQQPVAVHFTFEAPTAQRVVVVGDFNNWNAAATPLNKSENGVWSVILPLRAGRFSYSFIVDDREWHADPRHTLVTHDFGRPSSVIFVSETRI